MKPILQINLSLSHSFKQYIGFQTMTFYNFTEKYLLQTTIFPGNSEVPYGGLHWEFWKTQRLNNSCSEPLRKVFMILLTVFQSMQPANIQQK